MIDQQLITKTIPHSLEAEQAVLGAMLLDPQAVLAVFEKVQSQDFYKDAHRIIYEACADLFNRSEPIDLVTVGSFLLKGNQLGLIGGNEYLAEILDAVPTAANVEHHARIVREKSILRSLIHACTDVVQSAYENDDVAVVLDQAEAKIFDIAHKKESSSVVLLKDQIIETFNAIDEMVHNQGVHTGMATGFRDLDSLCSGLNRAEMVVLAARPSMGKTAFATALMEHVAMKQQKGVLFFSLEMSKENLVQRLLCSHARVSWNELRKGFLGDNGWQRLTNSASELSNTPIYIDDTPGITVLEMKTKARRLKAAHGLDMIIVDYLQLMKSYKRVENRQQEISEISRSLKELARELNVSLIALSQLSRAVESRTDHKPMLSDLRESGAIEQDADMVLMLMREEYYNPTEENKNRAQVILGKNRNGPTGEVDLLFLKEFTRFENLSYRTES